LTVHSRAILKVVKSMCNGIKKIKCTFMKCHTKVNSIPFTQLPHKFSYIVAILIERISLAIQRGNVASTRGTFPDSALLSEIFVL
jgi:hypothetical protein